MQVESYLIKRGLEFKRYGEEAVMNCPFCHDREKKFSINLITGLYRCFHENKCGVKGDFVSFQKKMGDKPEKLASKNAVVKTKKQYKRPEEEVYPVTDEQVDVYKYLIARGFNDETIKHFRIGATVDTVKLPYYKNGELVNIKYRNIKDKKKMRQEKDAEHVLFNRDNISDSTLIICEGEFDAMALYQYGLEATSVPDGASGTSWIDEEWEFINTFKHICLCFDNDTAGKKGAMKIAERIGLWRCSIVEFPFKDANECLVNKVKVEDIVNCFNSHQELSPETIVTPDYFDDKIQELFRLGPKLFGTKTAWGKLDDILKGWRGSEVTIWTGKNGAGKSTILNQVILDLAGKGEKSCVYSGEMSPERYLRWAIMQHKQNDNPSPLDIADSLNWMTGKLYILNITDMIEPNKLMDDFEYAARRYGCDHFIIDSLMKIKMPAQDEYKEQADFLSMLTDFAKKFNCHIHLVAHPRKTMTDTDEPGKVDIKGSSHISDLAHNVIVLYRPTQEQKDKSIKKIGRACDAILYVKKNREFGVEGRCDLYFDPRTKSFTDEDGRHG